MKDHQEFNLGNVKLLSGKILKSGKLVYKTYGKLNIDHSNVILLPTFYTGTHIRNEGFIGKNRAINPNKYFIISINMFGNALSSSPSNSIKTQHGPKFPEITLWDNVYCQHKLITEKLKIKKIALVTGWSMAGCQSYQWAAQYPDMVKSILPFCASSKTSIHNHVFLEGVKAAKKLKEIGVKPEIEAFDLGNMWFGAQLYKEGLLSDPPMFQMCLGIPWGAPATTLAMQAMKDIMPKEGVWSGFAISKNEMPFVAQTVLMGGNPRVGLEDNLYLSKGKLATNAQLVEKGIRIVNELGYSIMTPAETREKLKLIKHR
ncbi:alpha/beta fold hydrolase [Candidatus Pelagibacter sp.]|nr:alpha/beta fold hydrolase [Candidatus Pelagibacter sp.]